MTNQGVIQGGAGGANYYGGNGGTGVVLTQHDVLTNFGTIAGGQGGNDQAAKYARAGLGGVGVYVRDGATLINAGTIAGGAGGLGLYATPNTEGHDNGAAGKAVDFAPNATATLVVDPGAVFDGIVSDANGTDVLVLASGNTTGTISGIGSLFTGFGQIDIAPGAAWTISGDSAGFGNGLTINGFSSLDTIIAPGLSFDTQSFANGTLTLFSGGTPSLFFTEPMAGDLTLSSGGGGLVITSDVPCFASGTKLLGMDGEILVEDIQVGDRLVTVRENGPASRKVVWTGRRAIALHRHPQPELVRPVRITAGAIAAGIPERDLRLSPEHAIYLGGALFTAASLVNSVTIYQEQTTTHVTYHHIELESHDILMAEGLPCESFLDTGNKTMFESVSGIIILHPDFCSGPDAAFCAPLIREGAALDAIRACLRLGIKAA
jgi:hypothetical protein